MEIESSIVASQNALITNPSVREPQKELEARLQQEQRQATQLPNTQVVTRQGSAEAYDQAEKFRKQQSTYDNPSGRSNQAIDAYQSLAKEQKRSEIQQLMGVDTYV